MATVGSLLILLRLLSHRMTECSLLLLQVYRNLQYFVPLPGKHKKDESGKKARLELLKSISGSAVPGQLTALMGGSGAGKVRPLSMGRPASAAKHLAPCCTACPACYIGPAYVSHRQEMQRGQSCLRRRRSWMLLRGARPRGRSAARSW